MGRNLCLIIFSMPEDCSGLNISFQLHYDVFEGQGLSVKQGLERLMASGLLIMGVTTEIAEAMFEC